MPKIKGVKKARGRGRVPLAALGLERRERKIVASFTPSQYAALEREAEEEGTTIAALVAQRAVGAA